MPTMKVKVVATLMAVGAWLLLTVSACEQSKRAEIVSVEDIRAEAQQSADTADTRNGRPPGAIEEPRIARLEPFDFVPEMPPQARKPDVTVAARAKPEVARLEPSPGGTGGGPGIRGWPTSFLILTSMRFVPAPLPCLKGMPNSSKVPIDMPAC